MLQAEPQFAQSEVLRYFNHAQIYLCLGAAIATAGLLAAAFSFLRRRVEPLLLWFAFFAVFYGARLIMGYHGNSDPSAFQSWFRRVRSSNRQDWKEATPQLNAASPKP